ENVCVLGWPLAHPRRKLYCSLTIREVCVANTADWMSRPLFSVDPTIATAIDNEVHRQHEGLELIASENFVSEAVLEAMGSVFTNKYAEGYPGRRYYGGCEFTDVVENLARDRAKELFGAEH